MVDHLRPEPIGEPKNPIPVGERSFRAMVARRIAYPTIWLTLTLMVRAAGWKIRDDGVYSWMLTMALVGVPVLLVMYFWFRRTGDLPGEGRARQRDEDRVLDGRLNARIDQKMAEIGKSFESALHAYQVDGQVVVVGAEAQERAYLPVATVQLLSMEERGALRAVGEPAWSAPEVVRDDLRLLRDRVDVGQRMAVDQAIDLVDYACSTRTGVAIVPPRTPAGRELGGADVVRRVVGEDGVDTP